MIKRQMYFWTGLTFLCSLLLVSWRVNGVQAQPLLDERGRIEDSDSKLEDGSLYDIYTFQGRAGQWVKIALDSDDFDPYLVLFDQGGNQLADSDDISKDNPNSAIDYVLSQDETYQIVVNSYEPTGRGNYRLVVQTASANRSEKFQQLMRQGIASAKQKYFPAAIASFQQALDLSPQLDNPNYAPIILRNLGFSYLHNEQTETAQKYYDNALQVYQRQLEQAQAASTHCSEYIASLLRAIATVYELQGQTTSAQRFTQSAQMALGNNGREKAQICPTSLDRWNEMLLDVSISDH